MHSWEIVDAFIDSTGLTEFTRQDLAEWADITPDKASRLLQEHRQRQLLAITKGEDRG
jgi:CRP-like cAMP-binding protein